jgi:hypothetical protein
MPAGRVGTLQQDLGSSALRLLESQAHALRMRKTPRKP